MEALVTTLANRRVALEAEIAHASQRSCTNNLEVMRLMMEKLRVEEELKAIKRMNSPYSWDRSSFAPTQCDPFLGKQRKESIAISDIHEKVDTDELEEKRDMNIKAAISAFFASTVSIGGIAALMSAA